MCDICDEQNGEPTTCGFCSRLICFDVIGSDDIMSKACTYDGDLVCVACAKRLAEGEEEESEEWYFGDLP